MGMPDPLPTFTTFAARLAENHPNLAYLHLCESDTPSARTSAGVLHSNEPIRNAWGARTYVTARGHTRQSALEAAEKDDTLVAMGRYFISNPDLPKRWMVDAELTPYDRDTFYSRGPKGYTDWAFLGDAEGSKL